MPISPEEYRMMQLRLSKAQIVPPRDDSVEDESELHEFIRQDCDRNRFAYSHARMDRKTTTNKGVPDWIIFASRGRVFLIECKSRSGKLRTEQLIFKIVAEENGHVVHVIQSEQEYLAIVHGSV